MNTTRFGSLALALGAAAGLALAIAPEGIAKRGDVRVAGKCAGPSTSKLKLSEEDGRVEVEFEVDQNRNGVRWTVVLNRKGTRVARVTKRRGLPAAPSRRGYWHRTRRAGMSSPRAPPAPQARSARRGRRLPKGVRKSDHGSEAVAWNASSAIRRARRASPRCRRAVAGTSRRTSPRLPARAS